MHGPRDEAKDELERKHQWSLESLKETFAVFLLEFAIAATEATEQESSSVVCT